MTFERGRQVTCLVLAALLVSSSGCLGFLNPIAPEAIDYAKKCPPLPQECRNRVYIFFVTGMDPLDFANLNGVREFLNDLNYLKTYSGQLYHVGHFSREIRRLHHEDPEARFVLIGFSFGANAVRDIANEVGKDDIPIDLLVYCGGNTLEDRPKDRPANALRILNFLATGCIWNGADITGALNECYSDVWHFGSVTHLHTLNVLVDELTVVAARVPMISDLPAEDPGPHPARPALPIDDVRDEWDFLKLPAPTAPAGPAARPPEPPPSSPAGVPTGFGTPPS
jgi:hypothetical protein